MKIRQAVVTGQNQVELQESELDEKNLGPLDIFIETECTFISAGTELANYTGVEPLVFKPGNWCSYPWRSGYSNVGVVRGVGEGVRRVKVDERVFTFGNHSSCVRTNEHALIVPVPNDIPSPIAAASRMAAVAATALVVSEVKANPVVVVFGLGLVGNLAAQAFRIRGCRVVGVDPVEARRALAARVGVPVTLGGDAETVRKAIAEQTGGKMAEITVDAVGHSQVVMQALKCTGTFGQLILLGTPRAPVQGDLTELLSPTHLKMITIRGALEWCIPVYPAAGCKESLLGKQQMLFDWIQRGELKLEPLISHRLPPTEIKQAYEGLLKQPERYTGVVLDWKAVK